MILGFGLRVGSLGFRAYGDSEFAAGLGCRAWFQGLGSRDGAGLFERCSQCMSHTSGGIQGSD